MQTLGLKISLFALLMLMFETSLCEDRPDSPLELKSVGGAKWTEAKSVTGNNKAKETG